MSSVMQSWLKLGKFFKLPFKPMFVFQRSNPHTRTFDVMIQVGLHHIIMQKHVTRIGIRCTIDPMSSSESVGEPPCFSKVPFSLLFSFGSLGYCGFYPNIDFSCFRAFIDSQMLVLQSFHCYYAMFRLGFALMAI